MLLREKYKLILIKYSTGRDQNNDCNYKGTAEWYFASSIITAPVIMNFDSQLASIINMEIEWHGFQWNMELQQYGGIWNMELNELESNRWKTKEAIWN